MSDLNLILSNIAYKLGLPDNTRERALELLELSYNKRRGRHIEDTVLACIYRAILENNLAISMKEVESLSSNTKSFRRAYRDLVNILGLEHVK